MRAGLRAPPGQHGRPLGKQYPGGLTPRHEVPHLVVHLERRAGRATGVCGPDRQPCQRGAQGPQHAAHDAKRGLDQDVQLLVGLVVWVKNRVST